MSKLLNKKTMSFMRYCGFAEWPGDVRALCLDAWRWIGAHGKVMLGLLTLAALIALAILPFDQAIYRQMMRQRDPYLVDVAHIFRRWGSFMDTLFFTATVWLTGRLFNLRRWRRAAIACFLAGCFAGITVNISRFSTGRPRPKTVRNEGIADGFYGPTFKYQMQSFPSGHCASTFAGSTPLLIAVPAIGLPAFLSSTGILWSSYYSENHFATDLFIGTVWGLLFGLPFGFTARKTPDEIQMGAADDSGKRSNSLG